MSKVYAVENVPTKSYERYLVQFDETSEGWAAKWYVVSSFGGLKSSGCYVNHGKTLNSCMAAFKRGIRREFGKGVEIGELVHEGVTITAQKYGDKALYCDPSDESVHESFCKWAAGLFE